MLKLLLASLVLLAAGCAYPLSNPARAMPAYPAHLHRPESIDVQVFRDGEWMEIVNSSARSFRNVTIWLNQRYARRLDELLAGETVRLSLWDFYDERGEVFVAGGLFATDLPTLLRLTEIQVDDEQPLVGLVTIRAEDIDLPANRR